MSVYKKLTPSDVSITPFNTHKQYTYNSSSAGQNGVTFYSGQYSSQSIDFYEKYDVLGSKKYFQLDELYYNDYKLDIANMFGDISYRKTQRTLYDKTNILSIPSALYGYQVKPTTFYLSGSFSANQEVSRSAIVTDDGKGNLVSNDFTTGTDYFRDVIKRLMYVGPDNAFRQYNLDIYNHDNRNRPRHIGEPIVNAPTSFNTPSDEFVYDNSYYFNQLVYKDITFSPLPLTSSYNYPGIKFNGSTSYIQSPHNEKFDFNPENDFAISFFISASTLPSSSIYTPSVSESGSAANQSWASLQNITGSEDSNFAFIRTTAPGTGPLEISKYFFTSNYGFNIPNDALIRGIEVGIRKQKLTEGFDPASDVSVYLSKNTSSIAEHNQGDNKSISPPDFSNSITTSIYGGPTDTWGQTWTPSEINSNLFGLQYQAQATYILSTISARIYDVKITIHYSYDGYLVSKSTTKTVVAAPQEGKAAVYNLSNTGSGTVDVFAEPQYPFEVYLNSGSVYFDRFDGTNKPSISTPISSGLNHIHCQKTGSEMEIYVNAVKQASGSDTTVKHTQNKANVYIGTKGNKSDYYGGYLSQVMIYEDAFNQNQINNSYNTVTNTPVIGNIIYPHGIATITKPEYQGILKQYSSSVLTGKVFNSSNPQGTYYAGFASQSGSAANESWASLQNVTGSEDSNFTSIRRTSIGVNTSKYIFTSNYGFNIPNNANIQGIKVFINKQKHPSNSAADDTAVYLSPDTSSIGDGHNKGTNKEGEGLTFTTTVTTSTYGGKNDLWGQTWTPSIINSPNFGVQYEGNATYISATTSNRIYDIGIQVFYNFPWESSNYVIISGSSNTWPSASGGVITINNTDYQIISSSGDKMYINGTLSLPSDTSFSLKYYTTASNDYQLKFQASHLIYENEVLCTCDENEFNNTNNVTARKIPTSDNQDLANFATSSLFKPYVTTIGLYNDDNELLLVGKLGQPVRMSDETDTTFLVRYDT